MLYMENHIGRITFSDHYLRQLTEQTVLQCFGVAGFAQVTLADRLFDRRNTPVMITAKNDKLEIAVHVRVIYGVNIPSWRSHQIRSAEPVLRGREPRGVGSSAAG
ncbi:MAG: hypothetical protein IKI37_04915 [Oscillospiraceae bacterium]|nr:hypothetical protein [Oscillospiraceae bacterium]